MSIFTKFTKNLLRLGVCLFCLQSLPGQMTPNAPVQNFRLPRFGENGYTQWVLKGGQGIYDSEEQIRVEGMGLRVYSGDARMALELTLDSPEATLRLQENRAYSESPIEIEGATFKISGVGWTWNGQTKEIEVLHQSVVEFTQAIVDTLAGAHPGEAVPQRTVIQSEGLVLQTFETHYRFEFTNDVHAISGGMDLKSHLLIAEAEAPKGGRKGKSELVPGQLDSIRQLIAREGVVIEQGGRVVRAGAAEFFPAEERVHLSGTPQIEASGAYLSGDTIESRAGEIVILGGANTGRAQMILAETGGLGIQGGAALSSETIVLADSITMREAETENQFYFEGSVEVMSGAVQMSSQSMTIFADKTGDRAAAAGSDSSLKVGEVRRLFAEGAVRIEQSGQVATGEKVTFYPAEERAVLTGTPKVTNGEAVVTGHRMELTPEFALIQGSAEQRVRVTLPEMADLGYAPMASKISEASELSEPSEGPGPGRETVVESDRLQMIEEPARTLFRFTDAVTVGATNLDAKCERLDVVASEPRIAGASTGGSAERLEVERIEAMDQVEIRQSGRVATSNRAVILPREGKVILEGDCAVEDDRGRVSGYRMTLLEGERRAIVETGGADRPRNTITLPAIPAGKF